MYRICSILGILLAIIPWLGAFQVRADLSVPILVYHRLGPTVADSMTITTHQFEQQIKWIQDNGFTIIPLDLLIEYLRGNNAPPPDKSVVITVDDGHRSVHEEMLPLIRKYDFPCTLFIYPSAISNADYALTWKQLISLRDTRLVDIQSHTYWHPNFKKEKKRLNASDYDKFVFFQLSKSQSVLEEKLQTKVNLLAWPFGIHDPFLEISARENGYIAAFTIERRHVRENDQLMALPRYLMQASHSIKHVLENTD